jgi:hypothetical protein
VVNKSPIFLILCVCFGYFTNAQTHNKSYSFNYLEATSHPRILLKKGEESKILESVKKNQSYKKIHNYILNTSDKYLKLPALVYKKRGKRLLYISWQALKRLCYLSYSYRITSDKKYLRKSEEILNTVCDFKDWNPSHFLDTGEMTMAVAIGYDWLFDDLKETTKKKIRTSIIEKGFKPSYNEKYNWFLTKHNNWNSVCNAGLTFGALAILDEEKEAAIPIIERALTTSQLPLKVFAPDGNYPEGPCYWNYGTTYQMMLSAALKSAFGSDKGLSNAKGFKESANFMLFAAGSSGKYFNYYDCGAKQASKPSLFWFANETKNPTLIFNELKLIEKGKYTNPESTKAIAGLPNMLIFGKDLKLSEIKKPKEYFFTGNGLTPVAIVRTDWDDEKAIYFGIKGGSASDGHSHMDQGTFVYDIGKTRWAEDFGAQSYITLESKGVDLWNMTQDSQRWDVFRYTNLNHNTLSINNQKHNVKGRAEILETYKTSEEKGAKFDLTSVLNFNNELKFAHRKGVVINNSHLEIEDILETNNNSVDVRWNMVTKSSAEIIDKNTIKLTQKGKTLFLKFEGNYPFKLAIRKSENPKEYMSEFGFKYGDYNAKNPGSVMVGFDANLPPNVKAKFKITFLETKKD